MSRLSLPPEARVRVNLQPLADPVAVNSHVNDTVVFRNVIVPLWTSLVTGGRGGLRDKKKWKKREVLYSEEIGAGKCLGREQEQDSLLPKNSHFQCHK